MAEPIKKTDIVRGLVSDGDMKKALSIAKDFRLGITKAQRSAMTKAYECMVHLAFYISIGTDIPTAIQEGVTVLTELYGYSTSM